MAKNFESNPRTHSEPDARVTAKIERSKMLGLSASVMQQAEVLLQPPSRIPDGEIQQPFGRSCLQVSEYLSQELLREFSQNPDWMNAHPVLLGSWGRQELVPKSDLDVLFLGPEEVVSRVVQKLFEQGIKIRSRLPKNPSDWSEGVETPDLLALWKAEPLTELGQKSWAEQKQKIFSSSRRKKILKDLEKERKIRTLRHDNQSNYLEPNLKYGPGGLRDLYQGLVIRDLFPEKFEGDGHELLILNYYFLFFLTLRQKVQFMGGGEILTGPEQWQLSKWFGFSDHQEFMRQVQRGLSRVSFYSEWIFEKAKLKHKSSSKKILKTPQDLANTLKLDFSNVNQHRVRRSLGIVFRKKISPKISGKILSEVLNPKSSDEWLIAIFRSKVIDFLCPRIVRLTGLTQHDQYHRLTADAHLLQACREIKRIFQKPKELANLQWMTKKLTAFDWEILSWTALYHDIAKGLPEDHSEIGEIWVRQDLKKYGIKSKVIDEVAWMVKNHLVISNAAFRRNPHSPQTWRGLHEAEVTPERLLRLTVFTALDIRATNLEAWNTWKARLLDSLAKSYLKTSTQGYLAAQRALPSRDLELEKIDAQLFEVFPAKKIVDDLKSVSRTSKKEVTFFTDKYRKTWVRIFEPKDQSGLLASYLGVFFDLGCSVQHAVVNTFEGLGVYDWFQIQTRKPKSVLQKVLLNTPQFQGASLKDIRFQEVALISEDVDEWVILFRGFDQKGCLLKATQAISNHGALILSARVHTWGRQIDDLFSVRPIQGLSAAQFVEKLKQSIL